MEAFSFPHMKSRLVDHFGENIIIAEVDGKANIVTFTTTASKIIHDFFSLPKSDDTETEKAKIIETAAKLIKSDIKNVSIPTDVFPSPGDINSSEVGNTFIPGSLQSLLKTLFVGKDTLIKQAAIGQAIMQAVRPRVFLSPLQLALGVQCHHLFGSRYLIDTLNALGFCCSYADVQKYEQSAALTNNTEIPGYTHGQFIQFVADNVDHNIRTIDGYGTFHGMGIIAAATPGSKTCRRVHKLKATEEDLKAIGKINVHFYNTKKLFDLKYGELSQIECDDNTLSMNLLWKTAWLLRPLTPSWNGTMQMIHKCGSFPGQSSVTFMPMIDVNPSDESCIYSTLLFVRDQAKKYNVTPVLTFDQPLWWKATNIISVEPESSDLHRFILRLGGLHVEMSFLGCIGQIMSDTGLRETLELVYSENAVTHMLSGKALARAIRGHGLMDMALQSLLISEVFSIDLPRRPDNDQQHESDPTESEVHVAEQETHTRGNEPELTHTVQDPEASLKTSQSAETCKPENDLVCVAKIFDEMLAGELDIEVACTSPVLTRVVEVLSNHCSALSERRTAKLWLQYMDMVEILRTFIKAERTGDWLLHLKTLQNMLPYFAAAGHNLYLKSVYVYLSNMQDLKARNPEVYGLFIHGHHVLRRSEHFWAGLSTDLVIEQILMRSLKTSGGLTRGRGMSEVQRLVWSLSRPACSEMNEAMQQLTGHTYITSEQHKESSNARQQRDRKDTETINEYLSDRNPFGIEVLKSISSGVVAGVSNADEAKQIGMKVVGKMKGQNVKDLTFRKKDQITAMNDNAGVKIEGETVKFDAQLLFQRLITAAKGSVSEEELTSLFTYELCTYPPSLFESPHLLREADKPALADALRIKVKPDGTIPEVGEMKYVIDGGCLLQWLPWPRVCTYGQICQMYADFVHSRYGKAVVVFDGYDDGPNTKDNTHQRRVGGYVGSEVQYSKDMLLRGKKNAFLANTKNKQKFIYMLSDKLKESGIDTIHASADADVLVVKTAVQQAATQRTTLVGDDTDLLVLLCYHVQMDSFKVYFSPRSKPTSKKTSVWDIQETKQNLGDSICKDILFLHAILGCDTTSKVYGIGKGVVLKMHDKCEEFRNAAAVFDKHPTDVTKNEIEHAGEESLLCLFKGEIRQGLDNLRVQKFTEKVAKSLTFVDPKILPPTSGSAKYHSYRVYLQIQEWKGGDEKLNPVEWGWKLDDNCLKPLTMDKVPAPESLLKVVRCTCKKGCKSSICSCKKVGLMCSIACNTCKGVSCENSARPDMDDD